MLATRIMGAMVALVLLTVVAVGSITYVSLKSSILQFEYDRARTSAIRQAATIEGAIGRARDDALILSKTPAIAEYFEAAGSGAGTAGAREAEAWAARLALFFVSQMESRKEYLQMRVLGAAGRELIRVERADADGAPWRVPEDGLQEKGQTAYFKEAAMLPAGGIYVSPINLNREHGKVQEPRIPVVRAAAPVRGGEDEGGLLGVVVINLDLRGIFEQARKNPIAPFETYLVNPDGDYLLHHDPAMAFGFDFGTPHRIQDHAPPVREALDGGAAATVGVDEAGERFVYALAPVRAGKAEVAWVARRAPERALLGSTTEALKSAAMGGAAALACAILLAIGLAYSLAQPLKRLTQAMQRFAAGDPEGAPVRATGEIGVLAQAFEQMRRTIAEKTEALRLEVGAKTTAMKEASRLAETERLYSAVVGSTDDAVVTKDLNRVITGWNRAAERLFGYTAAEAIGREIDLIVPEDRRAEQDQILARLKQGERIEHLDTVRRAKDGGRLDVSLTISPLRNREGEVIGASKIVRDLSERRMAEERFQLAVEACPSGMVMIDQAGKIVLVNKETERMFGYGREELLGQPVERLVPERFRGEHPGYREGYQRSPETRKMGVGRELKALRRDGTEFPVEIGLNPIESKGEHFVLAAVLDITERLRAIETIKQANAELERRVAERTKELEESAEALRRSNEELGQFAYVASHDLQEPLRAVAGCVDLLAAKYKGRFDEGADELIRHTVDGASRMRQQIHDLLALSRVGTRTSPPMRLKMDQVVEGAKRALRVALEESKGEVVHGGLPDAMADLPQVQQLLQNLIANGIKFRNEKAPTIRVTGEAEGEWCHYCVADNGIGIDPKYFGRLFTIFQRLHTRAEYPGTGIGLAICKKIVQRHGGRIWIESAPGQGAQFHFTLPKA
ncbi:MAG: PAS domain S-box protein [Planctomycetota bacterium]|nr:PAS domain S-box protein [Planctomycetota bacterium]